MCNDLGEGSRCCAGYSIVGAIFTVSQDEPMSKDMQTHSKSSYRGNLGASAEPKE